MSPGTAPHSSFPPPLLRISASPHDAHLLATFSQDSAIVRVLDVRQPGQALLELKGHSAPVTCIEWSNNRRGCLASGGDDSQVLIWDLMGYAGAVPVQAPGVATAGGAGAAGAAGAAAGAGAGSSTAERGPSAAWQCDYEVNNMSWAPGDGGLGVVGGRAFWAVNL